LTGEVTVVFVDTNGDVNIIVNCQINVVEKPVFVCYCLLDGLGFVLFLRYSTIHQTA
jgi:hypothetical protein